MADYQSSYKGSVIDQTINTVINGQAGIQGVSVNGTEITPDSNNKVNVNIPGVLQTTGSSTTEAMSQNAVTNALGTKASVSTYSATLLASGWNGSSAPYTQTVNVSGILSTDKAFGDIVLSDDTTTAQNQMTNWAYVSKMVTSNDSITATSLESKPTIDLPISLIAIR